MTRSEKIESVVSCGISWDDFGVNNWALTKEQALSALDRFSLENIFVLGGDVYQLVDGNLESNNDNWYCDRNGGEDTDTYLDRSISISRQYISSYHHSNGQDAFFVIVAK